VVEPSTAVAIHVVHLKLDTIKLSVPAQTFYIPLPEDDLFTKIFTKVNTQRAKGPVISLISFSISTTGTVIWRTGMRQTSHLPNSLQPRFGATGMPTMAAPQPLSTALTLRMYSRPVIPLCLLRTWLNSQPTET
jgi:hypothetical protein